MERVIKMTLVFNIICGVSITIGFIFSYDMGAKSKEIKERQIRLNILKQLGQQDVGEDFLSGAMFVFDMLDKEEGNK